MQIQAHTLIRENFSNAISGLQYIPYYITESDHDRLIKIIDEQTWLTELKRRVQHYGYKYDYKKRTADSSMYLGKLPNWVLSVAQRLERDKLLEVFPDQVIINEYQPGQGIASHIDCMHCFGDTIISLSLGSTCVMEFTHIKTLDKIAIRLEPRSLVVLKGEARYLWQHRIAARKKDRYEGIEIVRDRRISMTFRKVIVTNQTKK